MSLLDELEIESRPRPRNCKVCKWFDNLEPDEQKGFLVWVEQIYDDVPERTIAGLLSACRRAGLVSGSTTFSTHLSSHTNV